MQVQLSDGLLNNSGEPFQYSYVRNLTRHIPDNYLSSDGYADRDDYVVSADYHETVYINSAETCSETDSDRNMIVYIHSAEQASIASGVAEDIVYVDSVEQVSLTSVDVVYVCNAEAASLTSLSGISSHGSNEKLSSKPLHDEQTNLNADSSNKQYVSESDGYFTPIWNIISQLVK